MSEIELILAKLKIVSEEEEQGMYLCDKEHSKLLYDYITNLQEKLRIRDTNWQSLKYYLEKLYDRDYIEEEIFDDICNRVNELESQIEIKSYQKEITNLQEKNEDLKDRLKVMEHFKNSLQEENEKLKEQVKKDNHILGCNFAQKNKYKSRCEKAIKYIEQEAVFYDSYDGEDTMLEELCERYYKELLKILNGD